MLGVGHNLNPKIFATAFSFCGKLTSILLASNKENRPSQGSGRGAGRGGVGSRGRGRGGGLRPRQEDQDRRGNRPSGEFRGRGRGSRPLWVFEFISLDCIWELKPNFQPRWSRRCSWICRTPWNGKRGIGGQGEGVCCWRKQPSNLRYRSSSSWPRRISWTWPRRSGSSSIRSSQWLRQNWCSRTGKEGRSRSWKLGNWSGIFYKCFCRTSDHMKQHPSSDGMLNMIVNWEWRKFRMFLSFNHYISPPSLQP